MASLVRRINDDDSKRDHLVYKCNDWDGVVTTAISTYFQDKAKAKVGEICAIIIPYYILFKLLIWLLFN